MSYLSYCLCVCVFRIFSLFSIFGRLWTCRLCSVVCSQSSLDKKGFRLGNPLESVLALSSPPKSPEMDKKLASTLWVVLWGSNDLKISWLFHLLWTPGRLTLPNAVSVTNRIFCFCHISLELTVWQPWCALTKAVAYMLPVMFEEVHDTPQLLQTEEKMAFGHTN